MENSPDMPAHMFKDAFKSKGEYVFVDLVLNPFSDWGVQRKRRWQAALKVSTVIWSGAVGAEDQQAQFDAIFGHGTDGQPPPAPPLCDAYLVSSADEEKAHCNALAAKRGLYPRPGHTVPLGACLSECYLKHAQLLKKVHLVSWKHSCFAADISQNPKYCVRGGDALPAATTSSLFFSFSQDLDPTGAVPVAGGRRRARGGAGAWAQRAQVAGDLAEGQLWRRGRLGRLAGPPRGRPGEAPLGVARRQGRGARDGPRRAGGLVRGGAAARPAGAPR
ncbi:unnamed protein product [Prorocentrum cordatum]|uniref:Uncharacterized protein n=1 Tax=Prorocentrum cordatum TaxID=2364126 RepID=A0ABN9Q5E6_9DINO|nr:unnamed protein product [Polarella glacialis]